MSRPIEQFACVYAREFPAQVLLRLRPELQGRPCAVLEGTPPSQRVCSCNAKALSLGVEHGMTPVELETIPAVIALARSGQEEASTRAALLECIGSFSPSLEELADEYGFVCVADVMGTERLHGQPASLARLLIERMRALGIAARVAIASNFHAAVCLARGMHSLDQIVVVSEGQTASALAPLPLHVLDLDPERAETFELWGIKTLGALAALPEEPLIARVGQDGKRLRELASGSASHLFVPIEPPFALEEFIELASPVELLESLLFVLGALLGQIIVRAANRALALAAVTATLNLEGGGAHSRTVRPALPTNDKQLWIKLLHMDLEMHPPDAAILSLRLAAEPGRTSKVQLGLFSPQLPDATRLDVTLARIRALVGDENVGSPVLNDSHRSDDFKMQHFKVAAEQGRQSSVGCVATPLRQLRPPEDVTVILQEHALSAFFFRHRRYEVERAFGPWLGSGDWWNSARWGTQSWDVIARHPDGSHLYGCLVRDAVQNRWQMAGLYD